VPREEVRAWQRRRGRFNHDWLKNQYIQALGKWINVLRGDVDDPGFDETFMTSVFPQWVTQRVELSSLLEDFELTMSPAKLFESRPLASCDPEMRAWLPAVIHQLWLTRYGCRSLLDRAWAAVEEVDRMYEGIERMASPPQRASAEDLAPFAEQFIALRAACEKLGAILSQFPSTVLVI
jgi:hypothetical protein